jgi:mycothiol system anti-sigma-R factor
VDCDGAIHRVYEYLDGELTVWKRRAIARHLDECPPCAEGFTFELELRRVVVMSCDRAALPHGQLTVEVLVHAVDGQQNLGVA